MQITTLEQLAKVEKNHTLFLINPFGQGDQSRVSIEKFTVHNVLVGKFRGRVEFKSLDIDYIDEHSFVGLLFGCKYVYKLEDEAEGKLKEIRKGLHDEEVKAHHDSCKEEFGHYGIYF